MFKGLKNGFNYIRYGDLEKRKKWFVGIVAFLFIVVLLIWVIFFFDISIKKGEKEISNSNQTSENLSATISNLFKEVFGKKEINIEQ